MIAVVAIGGLALQYSLHSLDLKQAAIDRDMAVLAKKEAEADVADLQQQLRGKRDDLNALASELDRTKEELKHATKALGRFFVTGEEVPSGEDIQITGKVIDENVNPIEGATVAILSRWRSDGFDYPNGKAFPESRSGSNGEFSVTITSGEKFDMIYGGAPYEIGHLKDLAGNVNHKLILVLHKKMNEPDGETPE